MAYSDPHVWAFKETMDANANDYLNILVNNLSDLADRHNGVNTACAAGKQVFFRFGRWLYYKNQSGKTASVAPLNTALGSAVSLPDVSTKSGGIIDLENEVSWLVTGMFYSVDNVEFAVEMETV